jgi:hypothetical protein
VRKTYPQGFLKKMSDETGILECNLSSILSGNRGISTKRALALEAAAKNLGFNFPAEKWLFSPTEIKSQLLESHVGEK